MVKNVKIFPIYRIFSSDLLFFYATQLLFLTMVKGYSIQQVLFLDAVYGFAQVICQIPSTYLIEKIGVKKANIIACICWLIAIVFYIFTSSYGILLIGEFIRGFGSALILLCNPLMLFLSLKKEKKESLFPKIDGNGLANYLYFDAFAGIISGILFSVNGYLPMIFCIITTLVLIGFSMKLNDVEFGKEEKKNVKSDLKDYFSLFRHKLLLMLFTYGFVTWGVIAIINQFQMIYLKEIGLTSAIIGIIFSALKISRATATRCLPLFRKKFKEKILSLMAMYLPLTMFVTGMAYIFKIGFVPLLIVLILIFILQMIIQSPYRTMMKWYINSNVETNLSSKALSIYYISENLGRAFFPLIAGIMLNYYNVGVTSIILSIGLTIPFTIICIMLNKKLSEFAS